MIAQLMAEIFQVLGRQAAFEKRPRINARGRMSLKVHAVAGLLAVGGVEEMVEADLEQRRDGCVGGDVAADAVIELVLPRHHSHRVPAGQALDAPLERPVAGIRNFLFRGNGVDVWGVMPDGQFNPEISCALGHSLQQEGGPVRPGFLNHLI